MKKTLLSAITFFIALCSAKAADVTISIVGFTYSPDNVTVNVGDNIIFSGNLSFHPTVQVDQTTWNANGSTSLPGGFSFTTGNSASFTITSAMAGATLYYVCTAHALGGMKGRINVNVVASINENRIRDFNFTVFPNPVTSNSQLNISLKKPGKTTVALYDINGRMVEQVLDKVMDAGEVTIPFRAAHLQKGAYFLLMRTPEGTLKKQILIQ